MVRVARVAMSMEKHFMVLPGVLVFGGILGQRRLDTLGFDKKQRVGFGIRIC